jgi:hypothetical protein
LRFALAVATVSLLLTGTSAAASPLALPRVQHSPVADEAHPPLWVAQYDDPAGQDDRAHAIVASPEGSKVFVTGFSNGPARVYDTLAYDATTGEQLWEAGGRTGTAYAAAVGADGKLVFVTGSGGTVAYDASTGATVWANVAPETDIAASADSSTVFTVGASQTAAYRASDGKRLWVSTGGPSMFLGLSPDGTKVFVSGHVNSYRDFFSTVAYDSSDGEMLWQSTDPVGRFRNDLRALSVSPDGSKVFLAGWFIGYSGDHNYVVIARNARTGTQAWVSRWDGGANGRRDDAYAMAVSPDGSKVFVTGRSKGVSSYDYATVALDAAKGGKLWVARADVGSKDDAYAVGVSPDGRTVFVSGRSGSSDGPFDYVTIAYQASSGAELWTARYAGAPGSEHGATALFVSSGGSRVFVTGGSEEPGHGEDYVTLAYDAAR